MLVEVKDLEVRVDGQHLLSLEAFTVPDPGPTMVMGPNGSGKSTLLRVIAALQRPAAGRVSVLGQTVWPGEERVRRGLRGQVVLCRSEPVFFRGSVEANVAFGVRTAQAREALREFGLEPFAKRRPSTLSSGEARRVDLARALVRHPKLLLLDEPTAHLDDAAAAWVVERIERLCENGTAVVFSNHADPRLDAIAKHELRLG